MIKNKFNFFTFVYLILLFGVFSSAANVNWTEQIMANECLNESQKIIYEMNNSEIPTLRVIDLYETIRDSYDSQMVLINRDTGANFDFIIRNCENLKEIERLAFLSKDLIGGLEDFYSEFYDDISDRTEIGLKFDEIYQEFNNERYEEIEDLVDEAYDLIIEAKTSETAVKVFYQSTTRGIKNFIFNNYKIIIFVVLILFILFLIFRKLLIKISLNVKSKRLKLRKEVLMNLIKEAQNKYFEKGDISKEIYEIRVSKFSDLIRDIESEELNIREAILRNKRKNKNYSDELLIKNKKYHKKLNRKRKRAERRKFRKKIKEKRKKLILEKKRKNSKRKLINRKQKNKSKIKKRAKTKKKKHKN